MKYERLDDLYSLHNRLTLDYVGDKDFEQTEEDRLLTGDLIDKIEQGTLIELPCKVGDTVYVIIKAENGFALLKDICDGFMIKDGEVFIGLQTYNVGANKYYFTREEAEKRLKELQNG